MSETVPQPQQESSGSLASLGRESESDRLLYEQALTIAEKTWEADHPNTKKIRQRLAELRQASE